MFSLICLYTYTYVAKHRGPRRPSTLHPWLQVMCANLLTKGGNPVGFGRCSIGGTVTETSTATHIFCKYIFSDNKWECTSTAT